MRESDHFAGLLLDGSIEAQLLHSDLVQGAHYYGRNEAEDTQQRSWKTEKPSPGVRNACSLGLVRVPVRPTAPERPLHAILVFKPLREEEVQDRAEPGKGQGHTERQSQLLPFEPEGCDSVLHN